MTSNGGGTQNIGWTWEPAAANLDFLRAGDNLTVSYAVQVGDSTAQTLTFTVTGTNDAAVIGTPPDADVTEDDDPIFGR